MSLVGHTPSLFRSSLKPSFFDKAYSGCWFRPVHSLATTGYDCWGDSDDSLSSSLSVSLSLSLSFLTFSHPFSPVLVMHVTNLTPFIHSLYFLVPQVPAKNGNGPSVFGLKACGEVIILSQVQRSGSLRITRGYRRSYDLEPSSAMIIKTILFQSRWSRIIWFHGQQISFWTNPHLLLAL